MFKKVIFLVVLLLLGVPVFAQSVDTAWIRRYNGPVNSNDEAYSIAVDNSSNVYVTGRVGNIGTGYDFATIKYSSDGDTVWVRIYNGPGNSNDEAYAIVVDDSGKVYVTGRSKGNLSDLDYTTIKYNPNGDTAWVRRYNGTGNLSDEAHAIALDGSGNVYVTGISYSGVTYYDYATIKYYPNGDTAWVRRYNGLGNSTDWGRAITLDGSGNVYVTGYSTGSGTDYDYATIKYDPQGNELWVKRHNGQGNSSDYAWAIAVDDSGNVFVTGGSFGSETSLDYTTIKYNPNGDTAWVRRYNGPGNSTDETRAIALDDSGNVYVTGISYGSGTYYDYATIKYYPNGDTAWIRRYSGPGNFTDGAHAITLDGSGNVYVTGNRNEGGPSYKYSDYATIKYYPNGDTAWIRRYNGPGNSQDQAYAMTLDSSGNVYVTGCSYGSGTSLDYATIKYVQFLRGNVNGDTTVSVSDVVYLINYLFKQGPEPIPAAIVGDANCDGQISISDIVYLIAYLFKQGPSPCI